MPPKKTSPKSKKGKTEAESSEPIVEPEAAEPSPKAKKGKKKAEPAEEAAETPKAKKGKKKAEASEDGETPKAKRGRKKVEASADTKDEAETPKAKRGRKKVEASADIAEEAETPKTKKGKKKREASEDAGDEAETPAKKSKKEKAEEKTKLRKEASLTKGMDFTHECKTADGRKPTVKIASWNINGIRAWLDKGGLSYITDEAPDVLCVQETKCSQEDMPDDAKVDGYYVYFSSAEQAGYAGTGMYCKTKPIDVSYGLGIKKHDSEGRVITAEFEKFFLVTSYVPNSGRGLPRLPYRTKQWDVDFREHLNKLNQKKPVVMCGDLNVAHLEIDLANPKTNRKTAGFTNEERQGFTDLLDAGYIDSFRELYPEKEEAYTFWTYMGNARGKNIGWRLDYFVLSERIKKDLCDNVIRKNVMGSDHCPIVLYMAFD